MMEGPPQTTTTTMTTPPPAGFDPSQHGIDVSGLSEGERKLIWGVLKRDEDLRKRDEQRINRLKAELQWLRRRGAIKGGLDPATSCARCRLPLGRIINRGAPCTVCRAKVCKSCRVHSSDGADWICVVCHKQLELEAATGEWMNEFVRRASRRRDRKAFVPPSDLVKECIARAHHERSQHARMEREGGHQLHRQSGALAVPSGASMSARRKTFMEPSVEQRRSRQLPNVAVAASKTNISSTVDSSACDTQPPTPAPTASKRPASTSFADVTLIVGNHFVREGSRDESPQRDPSPGTNRSSTGGQQHHRHHRQMPPMPLARQRSTSPRGDDSSGEASDCRSWCEVDGEEEGEVERVQLRVHPPRSSAADSAPVPSARKRLLPTTPGLHPTTDHRSDSGLGTEGCASPKTSHSGSGASRQSSTNSGCRPESVRNNVERRNLNGRSEYDQRRHNNPEPPTSRFEPSDRNGRHHESDRHSLVRTDSRGGIGGGGGGGGSESQTTTSATTTATTTSSAANSASDLSDSEAEPAGGGGVGGGGGGGIVFRKVTLKRRKKREAPQPPSGAGGATPTVAVDSTTSTDVGTDDHDEDDGRDRISYVPLPRWAGLPGATFSLPRLISRGSATHLSCQHHFPRSGPSGSTTTNCSIRDSFTGGNLTHASSIDSLWWDSVPPGTAHGTTVIAVNSSDTTSGTRHEPCGRSASPCDGHPIRFTSPKSPLGGGLSRSLEAIDAVPGDDYPLQATLDRYHPWHNIRRRDVDRRRRSDSYDDLRVSSPEYEEDYSLCGGFPASNNNNSDSCSDILLHVNDRIVPEGEEYRIVFISSSSSKSSGLNSADGLDSGSSGDDSTRIGGWYGTVPPRWPAVGRSRSLSPPPPLPATPPPKHPPPLTIHFQSPTCEAVTNSVRCGTSPTYTFDEDELFGECSVVQDDWGDDDNDSPIGEFINVCSRLPPVILRNHTVHSESDYNRNVSPLQAPASPLPPPGGFRGTADDLQHFPPLILSCEDQLLSPPAGFEDSLPPIVTTLDNGNEHSFATLCEVLPEVVVVDDIAHLPGIMRHRGLEPGAIEFSDETDLSDDEASSTSSDSELEGIAEPVEDAADCYYVDDNLDSSDDDCTVGSYDISGQMETEDVLDNSSVSVESVNVSRSHFGEVILVEHESSSFIDVGGDASHFKLDVDIAEHGEVVRECDVGEVAFSLLETSVELCDVASVDGMSSEEMVGEVVAGAIEKAVESLVNLTNQENVINSNSNVQPNADVFSAASIVAETSDTGLLSQIAGSISMPDERSISENNFEDIDNTCETSDVSNEFDNETLINSTINDADITLTSDITTIADYSKPADINLHSANNPSTSKPCEVTEVSLVATTELRMTTTSKIDDGGQTDSAADTDKTESDTDSQDTVIEGEAYRRIRQVAIREKLMNANREWEMVDDGMPFFPDYDAAQEFPASTSTVPDQTTTEALIEDSTSELESVSSDVDDGSVTASRPGANLQALIAQSRALSAARHGKSEGTVADTSGSTLQSSVLEKYFVSTLEHVTPPGTRKHVATSQQSCRVSTSPEVAPQASDTDDAEEFDDSCSDISDQYRGATGNKNSETTTDEDSEATFDDDDDNSSTASSTSSDEGSMCLQQVTVRQCVPERQRHQSLDMSLHTIMEESCEESEGERERYGEHKRQRLPSRVADPSDLERYFQFAFAGHASTSSSSDLSLPLVLDDAPLTRETRMRPPRPLSEVDSEFSDDTVSETESSVFSETGDHRGDDVDDEELARLASSRLEKYFLTGFLGLEAGGSMRYYGEDDPVTPTGDRPGGDDLFYSPGARRGSLAGADDSSSEEESTPFEVNDGCDTIKRCKKKERSPGERHRMDISGDCEQVAANLFSDSAVASDRDTGSATPEAEDSMTNETSVGPSINSETLITSPCESEDDKKIEVVVIDNKSDIISSLEDLEIKGDIISDDQKSDLQSEQNPDGLLTVVSVEEKMVEETQESQSLPVTILADQPLTHLDNDGGGLLSWDATCYGFTETSSPLLGGGIGRGLTLDWKQQSRDSGFIGSSDDLLHVSSNVSEVGTEDKKLSPENKTIILPETANLPDVVAAAAAVTSGNVKEVGMSSPSMTPSASHGSFGLFRSSSTRSARSTCSDDEAHYIVHQLVAQIARSMTRSPQMTRATAAAPATSTNKPSEMEEFECQLTRLMLTVPGVDATVKEIVEELSSTDYCSDSYEESSEDYAGSDHEVAPPLDGKFPPRFVLGGAGVTAAAASLRRNDSGRSWRSWSSTASRNSAFAVGGDIDDEVCLPEETMSIYNRFMESLSKMTGGEEAVATGEEQLPTAVKGSPPITAKIVHHIRSRLTSLMREVHDERTTLATASRPQGWSEQHLAPSSPASGQPRRTMLQWNKPSSATASAAGDELSLSSTTSSANFDSEEDSPTDKELSVDSDEDPISALPPVALEVTRKKLSGCAGGSARALAEARAHVKAIAKSGSDLSSSASSAADHGSSLDGLERWSSDVTIVGDGDLRFTSVRKSEPALSAPSPTEDERTSAASSKNISLIAQSVNSPVGSSRHVTPGKNGSTGSLYYSGHSQHHPRSKCRSEWEVWRGGDSAELGVVSREDEGAHPTRNAPTKHKSCDPLLPTVSSPKTRPGVPVRTDSSRIVAASEMSSIPVITSSPTQPPLSPPPPPPREKRRHGLASFLLGSMSKSSSSTSLRDGSDYSTSKQQVQFRSSLHLHSGGGGKKSKDDRRHQHQGSPSSTHPMQWLFGLRHRDPSSKKSGGPSSSSPSKHYSTSQSSPSVLAGRPSSPLDGVDVFNASGVDLSDDDELEDERRPSRHSSLVHVAHHQSRRELPADPYSTVPGHGFYRPSFVPSGAASSRDVSAAGDCSSRASTLPRAFSTAGTSTSTHLHANVSFLHQSQRNLMSPTSSSSYAHLGPIRTNSTNTLPHCYSLSSSSFSSPYSTLPAPTTSAKTSGKTSSKVAGLFQQQQGQRHHHHERTTKAASLMPTTSVKKQATVVAPEVGAESPRFRREVHSWPDESEGVTKKAPMPSARSGNRDKGSNQSPVFQKRSTNVPSISVVDCPERSATLSRLGAPSSHAGSSDPDSMTEEDIDRLVALHKNRSLSSLGVCSESMSSVYSAAGGGHYGNVTVRGEVQIGLSYNYVSGSLEVHIKQCRDLAPVDTKRNRSDPYAKVYLLPDKSKSGKRKTRVKKHTLNPLFNEVLKFQVTISELETRTLWLTVFHSDMFGRNEFLGEVTLPMGYEAWDDPTAKWYMLQEKLGSPEEVYSYKGDLLLALRYVPPDVTSQKKGRRTKGSLHVLVKEARNLMALCANGTSDPFCKCYLLPDKGKGNKQKTPVVRRNCNPKWNHTFVYEDICLESLHDRCLELTVWDYDRLTSNDFLGGVRLSQGMGKCSGKKVDWMDSRGEEVSIWQAMLERPNVWVDGTVLLRPSMDHRQTTW